MIKIILTDEDLTKAFEMTKEVNVFIKNDKLENFIFDEYDLEILYSEKSEGTHTYFKAHVNGVKVEFEDLISDKWCSVQGEFYNESFTFKQTKVKSCSYYIHYLLNGNNKKEATREVKHTFKTCLETWLILRYYIMTTLEEREKEIRETKCRSSKIHKVNNKKKKYVYESKDVFIFNDLIEYVSASKSKHNITCEQWAVRGHYRHYKSGKVVFIKPFSKGKNRTTLNEIDKTYKTFIDG